MKNSAQLFISEVFVFAAVECVWCSERRTVRGLAECVSPVLQGQADGNKGLIAHNQNL